MFFNFFTRKPKDVNAIPDLIFLSRDTINVVPIRENGEPLVDIPVTSRIILREGDGAKWLVPKLRKTVVEMLVNAAESLPVGYKLMIMSAYIPVFMQQKVWDRKVEKLKIQHKDWSHDEVLAQVPKYAARPVKGAPHNTGGSVDPIIIDAEGNELDMGSPFGGVSKSNHTRWDGVTHKQRKNREMLYWAMTNAGFFNTNPFEWWHYAYGDRAWAAYTGAEYAIYDGIEEDK